MRFPIIWRVYDLFGREDRAGGALPPELEGKSALEVAQYYQNRERQLSVQPTPAHVPPPPPPPSREDFDSNPLEVTQRLISQNTVSKAEFQTLTQAAQAGLVATAKMAAQQKCGKYWNRFLPQMEELAKNSDPMSLVNPDWWQTSYNYLVGSNLTTLQTEEAEAAAAAARATSEGISNPSTPPPTPRELSPVEREVAAGLGISEQKWREGEVKLKDGRLPVTLDNRRIA